MQTDKQAADAQPSDRGVLARSAKAGVRLLWTTAPVLTFVVLILLWEGVVRWLKIPEYLLPAPSAVIPILYKSRTMLTHNSLTTTWEILLGFGVSVVTGIPLGLLIALSVAGRRIIYPLLVFLQLIPKIAIAPLFVVWFGFGMESKVMLTTLLTFFPVLLASMTGFQILDNRLLYLTKSMGATTWQTFWYVRFPSALPVIFSGLKTAGTIAATAAIVAEFAGANAGLGYKLMQATSQLDTGLIFAILLILTVIGIAMNYIIEAIEYLVMPWQRGG